MDLQEFRTVFPNRLKKLIAEHGGIMQVCAETKLARTGVAEYMNGNRLPKADTLMILSQYFHVSCDYLLGLTDEHNSTDDEDVRSITEYTGLNNDAIIALHRAKDAPSIDSKIISFLNDIFTLEKDLDDPGKYELIYEDDISDAEYQESQHRLLGLIAEYIDNGSIAKKQSVINISGLPVL